MRQKRETVTDRAYIADVIRSIDVLTAPKPAVHWKVEAEHLLEVFEEDDNVGDLVSTLVFYGYVLGMGVVLADMNIKPFDSEESVTRIGDAWHAIRKEYVIEMKKGVGTEDVDN